MINKKVVLLGVVLIAFFTACYNVGETVTPDEEARAVEGYNGFSTFFDTNKPEEQSFSVDISTGGTFTGKEGTQFTIPALSLVDAKGDVYTGTVDVRLTEAYSLFDMLASNISTVDVAQNTLVSGGAFNITFSGANGQKLGFAPGAFMDVNMPKQTDITGYEDNMQLFTGVETSTSNLQSPTIIWSGVAATAITTQTGTMTQTANTFSNTGNDFALSTNITGWANCDAFIRFSNTKTLKIRLVDDNLDTRKTYSEKSVFRVSIRYEGLSSIVALPEDKTSDDVAYRSYTNSIPANLDMYLLVFEITPDKELKFAKELINISDNTTIDIRPLELLGSVDDPDVISDLKSRIK